MTIAEIQQRVARVTYKPGYRIVADVDPSNNYRVSLRLITAPLPDARGGDGTSPVQTVKVIDDHDWVTEERLKFLVRDLVHEFELHEMYEWLRCDGKQIKDPHA
jgi:hypothetical protein